MSQMLDVRRVSGAADPVVARIARWARASVLREFALMGLLFLGYRQIRFLTRNDTEQARANAETVLDVQRSWYFASERSVQDLALQSETVIAFLNRYYVGVHFPLTTLFVLWILFCRREWYRTMRNWLIGVTLAALVIHVAYPLAPPRMMTGEGFVDTLRVYGPNIYPADTSESVANQFAAMPSLHFGWSVIVAAGFIMIVRSRWRWAAVAHPVITLIAIVATANHYWLDALVAGVLVAVGGLAIAGRAQGRRGRPAAPGTRTVVAPTPIAPVVPVLVHALSPAGPSDPTRRHLAASVRRHPSAERCSRPGVDRPVSAAGPAGTSQPSPNQHSSCSG